MTDLAQSLEITNKYGLHARASTRLAQVAQNYDSRITIARETGGQEVDAKSVLGILSLGAEHGETIKVCISGEDAEAAMKAVVELVECKFHED
jgi:phosphotransferase system HPr (HPr) family protein